MLFLITGMGVNKFTINFLSLNMQQEQRTTESYEEVNYLKNTIRPLDEESLLSTQVFLFLVNESVYEPTNVRNRNQGKALHKPSQIEERGPELCKILNLKVHL
jgi:hypothetical protein